MNIIFLVDTSLLYIDPYIRIAIVQIIPLILCRSINFHIATVILHHTMWMINQNERNNGGTA